MVLAILFPVPIAPIPWCLRMPVFLYVHAFRRPVIQPASILGVAHMITRSDKYPLMDPERMALTENPSIHVVASAVDIAPTVNNPETQVNVGWAIEIRRIIVVVRRRRAVDINRGLGRWRRPVD